MEASSLISLLDLGVAEAAQTKQAIFRTLQTLSPPAAPVTGNPINMLARNGVGLDQGET